MSVESAPYPPRYLPAQGRSIGQCQQPPRLETTTADGDSLVRGRGQPVHAPDSVSALVARAGAGDQVAWDVIVARYTNLLWSVARAHRLGVADSGDVVQTTWLRLVENLAKVQDPERLAGWLATTARRECLRVLRRSGREFVGGIDDTAVDVVDELAPTLDAALLDDERDAALWGCFSRLSERCQRLLRVLMATEPPAYVDVAQAMGMPIGSIGPTRMRCLDKLRQVTRDAGYTFDAAQEGSA